MTRLVTTVQMSREAFDGAGFDKKALILDMHFRNCEDRGYAPVDPIEFECFPYLDFAVGVARSETIVKWRAA